MLSGAPASYELIHRATGALVVQLTPRQGGVPDDVIGELADAIESESTDHAEGMGRTQQYAVRALDAGGSVLGEFTFRSGGAALVSRIGDELGSPTPEQMTAGAPPAGLEAMAYHPMAQLAAQQMRHTEALTRQLVEMSTRNADKDARIIREQQSAIDRYARREREMAETWEQLLCRRQERELEDRRYNDELEQRERLLERLNTLVIPAVARRIGMPALAAGAGAGTDETTTVGQLRRIFMGLPSAVQDQVLGELSDADKETLLSAFESSRAKQPEGAKKH